MKLKSIVFASALLGFAVFNTVITPTAIAAPTGHQIVVIDYQRVVRASKQYNQAQTSFMEKYRSRDDALKARNDALSREDSTLVGLKAKLDADLRQGKISGAALKQREADLKNRVKIFQNKVLKFRQDAQAFENERQKDEQQQLARIETNIRKVVSDYAQRNGYSMVIDLPSAIYYQPSTDITNEVIRLVK